MSTSPTPCCTSNESTLPAARFGSLLSTRDREQFVSLTAEVLVADDFLRRGYEVQTVQRSDQVSPDLLVVVDGLDVAVEVYSPRELLAVDAWVKEVRTS
jgi:hypothetical protein